MDVSTFNFRNLFSNFLCCCLSKSKISFEFVLVATLFRYIYRTPNFYRVILIARHVNLMIACILYKFKSNVNAWDYIQKLSFSSKINFCNMPTDVIEIFYVLVMFDRNTCRIWKEHAKKNKFGIWLDAMSRSRENISIFFSKGILLKFSLNDEERQVTFPLQSCHLRTGFWHSRSRSRAVTPDIIVSSYF